MLDFRHLILFCSASAVHSMYHFKLHSCNIHLIGFLNLSISRHLNLSKHFTKENQSLALFNMKVKFQLTIICWVRRYTLFWFLVFWVFFVCLFICFSFSSCTQGIWKFQGQGSNPSCSCNLHSKAVSLAHCTISGTPEVYIHFKKIKTFLNWSFQKLTPGTG